MKKQFGLLLLFVLFGLSGNLLAQRGGATPTVTVVPTITHGTCFNPNGIVEYEIEVSSDWENEASMNRLDLYNDIPESIYTHPDESLLGTINNVGVGVYTISGSVSALNSNGMWVGIPFSMTIWVGIQTVWSEKTDMITSPNSYSAKRNASTVTYGGVRSSNGISSGDGWIQMNAVFGNTTDNRVFLVIGETNPLGAFNPSSIFQQYIEFYKGSSGNGIRVWYNDQVGGIWGNYYQPISTNPDDRIRLVRSGSDLTIQVNNSTSNVYTLPQTYSGPMNITVRSLAQNDGCLDVVSSFQCRKEVYAKVERKLRGEKYSPDGDYLKFYVTEEYESLSSLLRYNVFSDSDRATPVLSGSQQAKTVQYGDNRYDLDVTSLSIGSYILEVVNDKKEKFYLRFIIE